MHPAVMDSAEKAKLYQQWRQAETKLQRCCDQLDQLNQQLFEEKARYARAKANQRTASQQLVYLRMQTLEGVRKLYYEYASRKAGEIAALWAEIQEQEQEQEQEGDSHADLLYMDTHE